MKFSIKNYLFIVIAICLNSAGCSNWLDINDNPNTAEDVDPKYLFNYAAVQWSGSRTGGDFYIPISQSVQIQADGDRYMFYGSYYDITVQAQNTWNSRYIMIGNNLQLALEQFHNNTPSQQNAEAQCKIILAMQIYEATMLFGDVPFSEAWNKDIQYPKLDAQKDVLNGIISMLDEAITLINPDNKNCIDKYDPYFNGDMNKWAVIANSLKFRTLMVMADADPGKASEIGTMLRSGNMVSSAADNMEFKYADKAGNKNPKYSIIQATGGKNVILFAHNNILLPMEQYNDSRISRYFTPSPDGKFRGLDTQELYEIDENKDIISSPISDYIERADCPDLIYSYQEQLLLEAEAYARGLGVSQDLAKANMLYRAGVTASCDYYKADADSTIAFIESLPDLTKLTTEEAVYEIHLQQWIDFMDRPLEAFVQWRRSGTKGNEVPALTMPPYNEHPGLIRRWEYPGTDINLIPNAPEQLPQLWEALWFDL